MEFFDTDALLLSVPWVLLIVYTAVWARLPRAMPKGQEADRVLGADPPRVSVIVPARNEASNIERCVSSLSRSDYPNFEIVVVDDRSDDDTAEIARAVPPGRSDRIVVIEGRELPAGWFGKPWACVQGAEIAAGEVLLFTDADTTHGPALVRRAVAGLLEDRADALSAVGRQLLGSFWERIVQPQIFSLLFLRYPRIRRVFDRDRWYNAIANGQFLMVRRAAYERFGGHGRVRSEVVEDLRFAQLFCKAGNTLTIREARDDFATRMYESLADLVRGWGKNLHIGAKQSAMHPMLGALVVPAMIAFLLFFWVLPTVVLASQATAGISSVAVQWGVLTVGLGLLFWAVVSAGFEISPVYALGFPLGALVAAFVLGRSWIRGSKVEWKGREYRVDEIVPDRPADSEPAPLTTSESVAEDPG